MIHRGSWKRQFPTCRSKPLHDADLSLLRPRLWSTLQGRSGASELLAGCQFVAEVPIAPPSLRGGCCKPTARTALHQTPCEDVLLSDSLRGRHWFSVMRTALQQKCTRATSPSSMRCEDGALVILTARTRLHYSSDCSFFVIIDPTGTRSTAQNDQHLLQGRSWM